MFKTDGRCHETVHHLHVLHYDLLIEKYLCFNHFPAFCELSTRDNADNNLKGRVIYNEVGRERGQLTLYCIS